VLGDLSEEIAPGKWKIVNGSGAGERSMPSARGGEALKGGFKKEQ